MPSPLPRKDHLPGRRPAAVPQAARHAALILATIVLCACEPPEAEPTLPAPAPPEQPAALAPPMRWEGPSEGRSIRLSDEEESLLASATEQARETLEQARTRWAFGDAPASRRWLTAFRSPVDHDADAANDSRAPSLTEYLWIEPAHWSAFRIEGWLRSQPCDPNSPLRPGELVAFPIEDFVDWVMLEDGVIREGGWTILLLENLFGRAGASSAQTTRTE